MVVETAVAAVSGPLSARSRAEGPRPRNPSGGIGAGAAAIKRVMTRDPSAFTIAIALNAEAGAAPDWVQLTPSGPHIGGRDGRSWRLDDPEAVVAAFQQVGADLPVDFEHATQVKGEQGEVAPAVGWIKEMEARNGALWGRVEWGEAGRTAISTRAYRYLSPVFKFSSRTNEILRMVSAGLTNVPNLHMAALNREGAPNEETTMNKAILEALGLSEGASETDALTAINTLKSNEQEARNRAATPDPAKFVPRADYDLALNRVSTFEAAEKARARAEAEAAVDAAIEAGKVAPVSRDYHLAACREEGGLERFTKMVEGLPEIVGKAKSRAEAPEARNREAGLSEEELAVCRQLAIDPKDFAEAKSKEEQ